MRQTLHNTTALLRLEEGDAEEETADEKPLLKGDSYGNGECSE